MYTAANVTRPTERVMRGEYECAGSRHMIDAYDSVYELRDGAWVHVGKLNGRQPKQAIADILNARDEG